MRTLRSQQASEPLRAPRLAEVLANRLRFLIVDGELRAGDDLPVERVMQEDLGVSRPTLREALRILETEGLIKVRRGAQGGATVLPPSVSVAAEYMGLIMQSHKVELSDLAAARRIVESTCAALSAEQRGGPGAEDRFRPILDSAEEVIDDPVAFTTSAVGFHRELALSSGNQTLSIIVMVLEHIWSVQERRWAVSAVEAGEYPDFESRQSVQQAHERILEAVLDGNSERARRLILRHLEAIEAIVVGQASTQPIVRTVGP